MKDDGTFELSEKLSQEDHEHLRARWDVTSLRRNATHLGIDPAVANGAEKWSYEEYEDRVAEANQTDDEPDSGQGQDPDPNGGSTDGSGVPATDGTEGTPDGDGPTLYAEDSPEDKPYEQWTNEQLRGEIQARNTEFADEDDFEAMSTAGNKEELVARLKADDESE